MDGAFPSIANLGSTAVLCYLLWHLQTKALPAIVNQFSASAERMATIFRVVRDRIVT